MNKFTLFLIITLIFTQALQASEVFEETPTHVVVREHPKTKKPYVSITSDLSQKDPFESLRGPGFRPDYRMLDPKVKSGEIPYEGPYTSAKKIYIFAASLATLGAASGAAVLVAVPASTAVAGTATGGGAYLAGAGIVTGAAAAGTVAVTKSNSNQDDFTQISKTKREKIDLFNRENGR